MPAPSDNAPSWALPGVLVVATAMAVAYFPLPADDAYIVARYVSQLYAGHGLVYNEGEFVNALTSPLHAGALALLRVFAGDFVTVYRIAAATAAIALLACMAWRKWGNSATAALFLALTLWCPFVAFWMVGGLETPMLLCVCTAVAFVALSPTLRTSPSAAAGLVLLATLAVLLRYDASLLVTPPAIYAAWLHRNDKRLRLAVVAGVAAAAAWAAFTIGYYGDPLPTSFYVKAAHLPAIEELGRGLLYVASFLCLTWLWLPLTAPRSDPTPDDPALARRALWTGVVLSFAYAVFASTKHMMYAYRFLVPYLPVVALLLLSHRPLRAARAALVLASLLAWQIALALFLHAYSQNPTLSLVVEGMSDAGERYEFSHLGARHTASFLATAEPQATAIREHWPRTALGSSRAPRVLVSAGGLLPFLLPDAYVLEQLVSYRHGCRIAPEPLADYLQVIYVEEDSEAIARERMQQGREVIGRWTFVADGLREKPQALAVEIWYRPSAIPLTLPETIGAPCKQ